MSGHKKYYNKYMCFFFHNKTCMLVLLLDELTKSNFVLDKDKELNEPNNV